MFASAASNLDIWSVPLDADQARVTGVPERLTGHAAEDFCPSVSMDGRTLVFLSKRAGGTSLWKKSLPGGREIELGRTPVPSNRLKISADGKWAVYRVMEQSDPQIAASPFRKQAIYATRLDTGETRRVCVDCGAPTHITPDGRLVLYETGSTIAKLGALRVATGEKWEFLQHSHHPLRAARVSPGGAWLALHLNRGLDGRQIYVVPFLDASPTPERNWTPITESTGAHEEPWWSPNGRYLYYLSDRDGWRCVWAQKFDARTGRAGEPVPIQHFHQARRSPLSFVKRDPLYVGLSVAQDRLVVTLAEITSNIWLADIGVAR
ncbi:MAG: hypothetical protein AAB225_21080 [Acidobacteriota bacterium]